MGMISIRKPGGSGEMAWQDWDIFYARGAENNAYTPSPLILPPEPNVYIIRMQNVDYHGNEQGRSVYKVTIKSDGNNTFEILSDERVAGYPSVVSVTSYGVNWAVNLSVNTQGRWHRFVVERPRT